MKRLLIYFRVVSYSAVSGWENVGLFLLYLISPEEKHYYQKQPFGDVLQNMFLKNFAIFTRKHLF